MCAHHSRDIVLTDLHSGWEMTQMHIYGVSWAGEGWEGLFCPQGSIPLLQPHLDEQALGTEGPAI